MFPRILLFVLLRKTYRLPQSCYLFEKSQCQSNIYIVFVLMGAKLWVILPDTEMSQNVKTKVQRLATLFWQFCRFSFASGRHLCFVVGQINAWSHNRLYPSYSYIYLALFYIQSSPDYISLNSLTSTSLFAPILKTM